MKGVLKQYLPMGHGRYGRVVAGGAGLPAGSVYFGWASGTCDVNIYALDASVGRSAAGWRWWWWDGVRLVMFL